MMFTFDYKLTKIRITSIVHWWWLRSLYDYSNNVEPAFVSIQGKVLPNRFPIGKQYYPSPDIGGLVTGFII